MSVVTQPQIPLAIHEAIAHGSCQPLTARDGWLVVTEVTLSPCCQTMTGFFIVRQHMPGMTWTVRCLTCETIA